MFVTNITKVARIRAETVNSRNNSKALRERTEGLRVNHSVTGTDEEFTADGRRGHTETWEGACLDDASLIT
jgi:hypothetical protein